MTRLSTATARRLRREIETGMSALDSIANDSRIGAGDIDPVIEAKRWINEALALLDTLEG